MLTSRGFLPMLQFSLSMLRGQLDSDALVFLHPPPPPQISVYTEGQFLAAFSPKPQAKPGVRLPVLRQIGIATGIGTGRRGIDSSVGLYHKLSQELNEDVERVADSLVTLQNQISSLAAVALQNRRVLNLLTAGKIGTCIFLGEECCYFVNQLGVIKTKVRELTERIQRRQQKGNSL